MFDSVIRNNDQSNYGNVFGINKDNFNRELEYKVFLSVTDKLKPSYNQIKSMLLTQK